MHMAVDANGNPVRIFVTADTTADCKFGEKLIQGIDALALLADRGYDVNTIIELARSMGMEIVIPPKKNRKEHRHYDIDGDHSIVIRHFHFRKHMKNPEGQAMFDGLCFRSSPNPDGTNVVLFDVSLTKKIKFAILHCIKSRICWATLIVFCQCLRPKVTNK